MEKIFDFYLPPEKKEPVGRLKSLGVSEDALAPLLFPRKYDDLRADNVIKSFSTLNAKVGEKVFIHCKLVGTPNVSYDKVKNSDKSISKTKFTIQDQDGMMLFATVFGPAQSLVSNMKTNPWFCLKCDVDVWNGQIQPKNIEWVSPRWMGRIMPIYPGKTKVITPDTVQENMTVLVDQNIEACLKHLNEKFKLNSTEDEQALLKSLGVKNPNIRLFDLIKSIHAPSNTKMGYAAQEIFKRLAAKEVVAFLDDANASSLNPESSIKTGNAFLKKLIDDMPPSMRLTNCQKKACREIFDDIASDMPMRRLLTGDVGTGKSLPIAISAAAMARMGKNVVILMPNEPLAEQMRRDIETWWPDTAPKLVAASTKKRKSKKSQEESEIPDSNILVGTTALNFRIPKGWPDLLIIDEQQKMSVQQRLFLAGDHTNVLEASATPLPRSLALIKFGGLPVSTLREAYVKKNISTSLAQSDEEKRDMFNYVKKIIADGYQALIIYPLAEAAEITDETDEEGKKVDPKVDRKSAEKAFERWENIFPGRVRVAHGKQDSAEKLANINALNKGEAEVLCSTTVVEVGLNVPKLRFVGIVHPERLGLSTLHQIRGRLCRNGGDGICALIFQEEVNDKSMKRLRAFAETNDGFKIAEEDMRLRGLGDIMNSSEVEQSGFIDLSFLPSAKLSVEHFEYVTKSREEKTAEPSISPSVK